MILSQELDYIEQQYSELNHRLFDLEDELQKASHKLPGASGGEILNMIHRTLTERGITQKSLADKAGCAPSAMSLMLRGKRRMPVDVMVACLTELGFKLVVLPEALPFTPEGE